MRGRPRKCDPDKVLGAALNLFWEQGYEATSMNDVSARSGMAKPGLYATFGNKDALYIRALTRYDERFRARIFDDFLASTDGLDAAVRRLLQGLAHAATSPEEPSGCFLVNTLAETGGQSSEIAGLARDIGQRRRAEMAQMFRDALARGALAPGTDPERLADFVAAQMMVMGIMASEGADYPAIESVIEMVVETLPVPRVAVT